MNDAARALTERYDLEAVAYRELWAPVLHGAAVRLIPELSKGTVGRVLDLGTGVGALLEELSCAFSGSRVVGADRSRGMLALAPAAFDRVVMDARQLALPAGTVDRVLMAFMLFHLSSPIEALREVYRVLRPGGEVATVTWGGDLDSPAIRAWNECLDAHGAEPPDSTALPGNDRVDTPEKMETLLVASGFRPVRCWTHELVHRLDADHLLRLRTSVGSGKRRFDNLGPAARAACLTEARRRLRGLSGADFTARAAIVYSIGRV